MKRLLLTTAACLALAGPALAESHMNVVLDYQMAKTDMFATNLIGMRVYSAENGVDASAKMTADAKTGWDDIGEINELVISADGKVAAVIVGVGGFLGMGEKDVAVDMSQISMMRESDDAKDVFLVIQSSAKMLEAAPTYVGKDHMAKADATAPAATDTAATPAATSQMPERTMLIAPAVERQGYVAAERKDLTTEMLTGAPVYGPKDEEVGEIGSLLLNTDGTIDRAVIDVGGFLGMGEKQVAVTFDELTILRKDGGDDVNVYIDSTQTALEAQPTYEN